MGWYTGNRMSLQIDALGLTLSSIAELRATSSARRINELVPDSSQGLAKMRHLCLCIHTNTRSLMSEVLRQVAKRFGVARLALNDILHIWSIDIFVERDSVQELV